MKQIERERVFLVKQLPSDLCEHNPTVIQVGDFYESNSIDALKIKQKGDKYELVKKEGSSTRKRTEHTIKIKKEEFDILMPSAIQSHKKERYFYSINNYICEIDLYKGKLLGYVRVEVEFKNTKDMDDFTPPAWFGEEITDINHDIHEDLGIVSFEDMQKRYAKKGIELISIFAH